MPFTALAPVPLANWTILTAAFGKDRVQLWSPKVQRTVGSVFNRHDRPSAIRNTVASLSTR